MAPWVTFPYTFSRRNLYNRACFVEFEFKFSRSFFHDHPLNRFSHCFSFIFHIIFHLLVSVSWTKLNIECSGEGTQTNLLQTDTTVLQVRCMLTIITLILRCIKHLFLFFDQENNDKKWVTPSFWNFVQSMILSTVWPKQTQYLPCIYS